MSRGFLVLMVFWIVLANTNAMAQNAGSVFNMFTSVMRAAIVEQARSEWSKLPLKERSCIEETLVQQNISTQKLIQEGISPKDPRVASFVSGCRSRPVSVSANVPAETPSVSKQSGYKSPYVVEGLALGRQVQRDGEEYKQWFCEASDQYPGFTRCSWDRSKDDSSALLHSPAGIALYINRYIEPATWKKNEVVPVV